MESSRKWKHPSKVQVPQNSKFSSLWAHRSVLLQGWSDAWWMDRLWSQPPDVTPPPVKSSTQPLFYVLSLNSHFSGVDLRRGALWPSTLQLQLHTARPLSPQGPLSQRATCLCHPLEIQQQEHLPFLHAALEAFASCEAILSPPGWPSPLRAKGAYPSLSFF